MTRGLAEDGDFTCFLPLGTLSFALRSEHAAQRRLHHRRDFVASAHFLHSVCHVEVYGSFFHAEDDGNIRRCLAFGGPSQNFYFTRGQVIVKESL
jgi:hypothetical protein